METQYGIIKAEERSLLPSTDLLSVNHKGNKLIARYPAFGLGSYLENIDAMKQQHFYHSRECSNLLFTPATTSESISVASHKFAELAKPEILDIDGLQLGLIALASEGIFANPLDEQGEPTTDEEILKTRLNTCKNVHRIYLGANDFGFAPYETFKSGEQDSGDFAEGGLARLLEHTEERTAPKLKEISSKPNYPTGVEVVELNEFEFIWPVLRVSRLFSDWHTWGRFYLFGDNIDDYFWDGSAFGVSK